MSPPASAPEEPPLDLAVLAADDRLLDALGRGEPPPVDDPGAVLLAAWLADLATDEPTAPATTGTAAVRGIRRGRRLVLGAAAVVILVAALGLGANHAGPASPLWPVVQLVSPQRAEVRAAEHAITLARTAAAAGRYDDAGRLLDQAATRVTRVRDATEAGRLRADIERVRTGLPGAAVRPGAAGSRQSEAPRSAPAASPTAPGPAPSRRPPSGSPAPGGPATGPPPLLPTQIPLPPLRSLLPPLLPSLPPLPIIGAVRDRP